MMVQMIILLIRMKTATITNDNNTHILTHTHTLTHTHMPTHTNTLSHKHALTLICLA